MMSMNGRRITNGAFLVKTGECYAFNQKFRYLHKAVMRATTGTIVDHRNGDKLDCQRSNLRFATTSQNNANSKTFRPLNGAYYQSNGWYSRITVNGRDIYLGRFKTAHKAWCAYKQAAIKHFGEFARP
jgi:hypothetical protein